VPAEVGHHRHVGGGPWAARRRLVTVFFLMVLALGVIFVRLTVLQ
jgi:hypothetical protein